MGSLDPSNGLLETMRPRILPWRALEAPKRALLAPTTRGSDYVEAIVTLKCKSLAVWYDEEANAESGPSKARTVSFSDAQHARKELACHSSKLARQFCSCPLGKKICLAVDDADAKAKRTRYWSDKFGSIKRVATSIRTTNVLQNISQFHRVKADYATALQMAPKDIDAHYYSDISSSRSSSSSSSSSSS